MHLHERLGHDLAGSGDPFAEVRNRVHGAVIAALGPRLSQADIDPEALRTRVAATIRAELETEAGLVRSDRDRLVGEIADEVLGHGPLERLLADASISEIMVNGHADVWIERDGRLEPSPVRFVDEAHLRRIVGKMVAAVGRRVDEASPMVDARLPDGSRVNAILPPLSLSGPLVTIRKFTRNDLGLEDFTRLGTLTPESAELLRRAVQAELSILVSGGTGAGKTTLLNALSSEIGPDERIVTIEDAAELRLRQRHVLRLESRPANTEGEGEVTIRDLVRNALRMRPDRIIVGEVRGAEALDMLQAMNTGHEGSLTTLHANSARDALSRVETMVLMAGFDLPVRAIRQQVSSALDLIVHLERAHDGARRVVSIAEVQGMEGDVITLQELFALRGDGAARLEPTGVRPSLDDKFRRRGIDLPASTFGEGDVLPLAATIAGRR
ncbi:MAG TPA: CpaF family protein [Solirubrobacteraceae bacterium]|nr:CpaF family protein [Solirubrobacteraceae bacterium]